MSPTVPVEMEIGGLAVSVFGLDQLRSRSSAPTFVAGIIVMHGRTQAKKDVANICEALCENNGVSSPNHLIAVSFDQRNHGTRLLNAKKNDAWAQGNPTHSQDMFSVQYGTACDASYLLETAEANIGVKVDAWLISGVSLGGHATLLALARDARFKVGLPIIGCADFAELMRGRWNTTKPEKRPAEPMSALLAATVQKLDPINNLAMFKDRPLLFVAGGKDKLVPHVASQRFLDAMKANPHFELFVDGKAGHEVTKEMVEKVREFAWHWIHKLSGEAKL